MQPVQVTDVRAVPGDSAFLIDDGLTAILYDSGFAFTGYQVAENIKKVLGERTLDYIFLTHSHYDHALGSAYVSKIYPEAKIVAGCYAAQIFQKPSAKKVMREMDRKAACALGVTDYEDRIDDLRVDIPVEDGDVISCGDLRFTAIALPGHTKCSVGYYLEDQKFLLSTETLGVYCPEDTYLPSFLVGYQMAMDSFRKAKGLEIEKILLPHYGVVEKDRAQAYLKCSEQATRETAMLIAQMLQSGNTKEEILAFLEKKDYQENVRPVYPVDAFLLNTGIMIERVRQELVESSGS